MNLNDVSRTKSVFYITAANITYRILFLVLNFVTRTFFIYTLGEEYFGLNGLFSTILNVLSLAELGIGSAVTFHLYKPIAVYDMESVKAIMSFYQKAYICIGLSIGIIGMCLLPFLKFLVKMDTSLPVNLFLIYLLWLANTVLSYLFFSYVQTLINAARKNYVITIYNILFLIISTIVCCAVLAISKNYIIYLISKITISLLNNYFIRLKAYTMFPFLKEKTWKKLSNDLFSEIKKDVSSIFLFRATSTISNSVDNIVISVLFGTVLVGYNTNYELICSGIMSLSTMVIYSFSSNVGNLIATAPLEKKINIFYQVDLINYYISTIALCGVSGLSNSFIWLWLRNDNFLYPQYVVYWKAFSMYLVINLNVYFIFRENMGLFQYGKYRNLLSGICNLFLTVILAKTMGIAGVFLATVISTLFISEFVFPKIVFQYGFHADYKKEMWRLGKKILLSVLISIFVSFLTSLIRSSSSLIRFMIGMCLCVLVPIILISAFYCKTSAFKSILFRLQNVKNQIWRK